MVDPQSSAPELGIRVLGPLVVLANGSWQRIGPPHWRAVLARLAVSAGNPVSVEELVETIWADPPSRAANQVHGYVSRLRRLLGDEHRNVLITRTPGYELAPAVIDVTEFERLAGQGEEALRGGDPNRATELLAEALALWRGRAFADVPDCAVIIDEANRLADERLRAQVARIDADLRLARHAEVLPELRAAVAAHPFDEHRWSLLLLALYRSGRQAEALQAYQSVYRLLERELAVRPGPELAGLHDQILAADPALIIDPAPSPSPTAVDPVPRQLPADLADFAGREPELDALDLIMDARAPGSAAGATFIVVTGGAGIGKSTLAVHWAHRVAGRFPDGQLFVNLRGFSSSAPRAPHSVLAHFLRAMGLPPERVPLDLDEAAALYRTVLAGRRMLIMLDNAADTTQVTPLLPGGDGTVVLVTSRRHLPGLITHRGARPLTVGPLDADDAARMISGIIGRPRIEAEPSVLPELIAACGGLPLALRLAAAQLAGNPDLRLADLTTALSTEDPLTVLGLAEEPEGSVRQAFDQSYRRLSAEQQLTFRRLGLVPGDDITGAAVAAMQQQPIARSRQLLDSLCARGMLTHAGRDRYALHDLLRVYARQCAAEADEPADRRRAGRRLFDWYLCAAARAVRDGLPPMVRLPDPVPDPEPLPDLPDREAAVDWLEAERVNLSALARSARAGGQQVFRLADALRAFYFYRRHLADWLEAAEAAVTSARDHSSTVGEAAAELSLAQARRTMSDYAAAQTHAERALGLARASQWAEGQATVYNELALVQAEQGQLHQAVEPTRRALEIYQRLANRVAEATLRINLGLIDRELGNLPDAAAQLEQVQPLLSDSEHQSSMNLSNLGETYRLLGHLDRAEVTLTEAVDVQRRTGHQVGLTSTLGHLSELLADLGRTAESLELAAESVALARQHHSPRVEGSALIVRSSARLRAGDPSAALADAQAAEALTRTAESAYEWIQSVIMVAQCRLAHRQYEEARDEARRAARCARESDYRLLLGQAETALAEAEFGAGRLDLARQAVERALAHHRRTGHRPGEVAAERLQSRIDAALGGSG